MTILSHNEISRRVKSKKLIEDFDPDGLEGASYDLRLGPRYSKHGETIHAVESNPTIEVLPGEFITLQTFEKLNMAPDLVGHVALRYEWTKMGLITLQGLQVDPGYQGHLYPPCLNASNREIKIDLKQKIFTIEFNELSSSAKILWHRKHQDRDQHFYRQATTFTMPYKKQVDDLGKELELSNLRIDDLQEQIHDAFRKVASLQGQVEQAKDNRSTAINTKVLYWTVAAFLFAILIQWFGLDFESVKDLFQR